MFRQVGIWSSLIFLVTVLCAACCARGGGNIIELIGVEYGRIAPSTSPMAVVIGFIAGFGLTSVVFSTADSLMLSISQFSYDNILSYDSSDQTSNPHHIKKIRLVAIASFIAGFIALALIFRFRQDLFMLLLALASGISVFAPFVWLVARRLRDDTLEHFTRLDLWVFVGLFVAAYAFAVYFLFANPAALGYVGLVACGASAIYAVSSSFKRG